MSLYMTLNIQLFTCIGLFEWNFSTFGVLSRDKSPHADPNLSVSLYLNSKPVSTDSSLLGETPWNQFFRRQVLVWITSPLQNTSDAPLQRPLQLSDHFMDSKGRVQSWILSVGALAELPVADYASEISWEAATGNIEYVFWPSEGLWSSWV